MINFKVEAKVDEFNSEGFISVFMDYLENQFRLGAKEFAKAALAKIPVRTGFVAGAFGTLTELIGAEARFNPIISFVKKFIIGNKSTVQGEFYYPPGGAKILKSPTSGRQFATPSGQIFTRQGYTINFNFEVDISYFDLNEVEAGHAPTAPWQAFLAGELAFVDYLNNVALNSNNKDMPQITDFIKSTDIVIGG